MIFEILKCLTGSTATRVKGRNGYRKIKQNFTVISENYLQGSKPFTVTNILNIYKL